MMKMTTDQDQDPCVSCQISNTKRTAVNVNTRTINTYNYRTGNTKWRIQTSKVWRQNLIIPIKTQGQGNK